MDTRFWGPSGWQFLHQITFAYEPRQRAAVRVLFETLPYVLPCKFCRSSLTEYMREDPLVLDSRDALSRWLWRIHNCVNDKLRGQGQSLEANPTFESVRTYYQDLLASGCSQTQFPGWTFLFSLAENHPLSRGSLKTTPIPDAPPRVPGMAADEMNQWNLLRPEERMPYYTKFWSAVGGSLPYPEWRRLWKRAAARLATTRRKSLIKSLWKVRCALETEFELQNRTKFADLCTDLVRHRSGCAKSLNARTCRVKRGGGGGKAKTRKNTKG